MDNFWKAALAVGGVSAIGAFIFLSLYKEWLGLAIFSKLSSDQTFISMLLFLSLTFISLLSFILAFVKSKQEKNPEIQQTISDDGIGVISTGDSATIKITKKK